jgi:hypothetical protein
MRARACLAHRSSAIADGMSRLLPGKLLPIELGCCRSGLRPELARDDPRLLGALEAGKPGAVAT